MINFIKRVSIEEKEFRIAIVDRFPHTTWYSWNLARELSKLLEGKGHLFLYGPRNRTYQVKDNYIYKSNWSSYLYPFQIVMQAVKDRVSILHIQFEFTTFGFHTSPLILLLLFMLRVIGIKTVITLHGPVFPKNVKKEIISNLVPRFAKIPACLFYLYVICIYKLISKLTEGIIVHARIFAKWLRMFGINNCVVIPHGVDIGFLHADNSTIVNIKRDKYEKTILFFGVLSPRKGLETLLQAFHIVVNTLPEVKLIIAGDEPIYYSGYKEKLIKITNKLGINNKVNFLGKIPDEVVGHLFHQADLVVLPYSYSISASGPLSLALGYGKIVIVSKTEFFSEIFDNDLNYLLFTPNNYEELAECILKILTNNEMRKKTLSKLKEKALNLSWNNSARLTIKLYTQILKGNSKK
jgi:glycosyltransferase involved in cell wall biosynthesis